MTNAMCRHGVITFGPGSRLCDECQAASGSLLMAAFAPPSPSPETMTDSGTTPSEAVFAFAEWLTCRAEAVTWGSYNEETSAAQ